MAVFVIPCSTLPDIYMIARHIRPITTAPRALDRGEQPTSADASRAIVRALNLPFFSVLRVTPAAAVVAGLGLHLANQVADAGFAPWQIVGLGLTIFLFTGPRQIIVVRLRSKLLYLSIIVNSLPLLFFAGSIVFKVACRASASRWRSTRRWTT